MIKKPSFLAKAPHVMTLIDTRGTNGFDTLMAMLRHTMPHLGALGYNPNTLIESLVLLNGDNVCIFLSKAAQLNH